MYTVVKQNGRDVNLVVMPDTDCVVNSGLGSIRGARHGRGSLFDIEIDPAAAPDDADGLAIRADESDELGTTRSISSLR